METVQKTGEKPKRKAISFRKKILEKTCLAVGAPGGVFSALAFLALTASLLAFPSQVKESVKSSIFYCLSVLTPSLFPFMALASFAVNSRAGEVLGGSFGFLARRFFRLPRECTAPVLMSFLGGYPAGARGASLLLEQGRIDREQAGRMMLFCVNPGVAFVVTFLGGAVLRSFHTGWLLFFAVSISGLVLGILSGLGHAPPKETPTKKGSQPGNALMRSVSDASESVVKMCACVVLFSGFTALLHGTGVYQALTTFLSSLGLWTQPESAVVLSFLIEVTGGAGDAARFQVGPVFYAFGLAFGGLCVHLQVFSFFPEFPLKKWKFFLFRFLHGLLAAGVYAVLARLFPGNAREALAQLPASQKTAVLATTLSGGLSLLLMCLAFLIIATKEAPEEDCKKKEKMIK